MAYFAVDVSLAQLRAINTQVVVEATDPNSAHDEALRVFFATIGVDPSRLHVVEEEINTSNIYQITPDEETDEASRIPYVYDVDKQIEYLGPLSDGDIFGVQPNLESLPGEHKVATFEWLPGTPVASPDPLDEEEIPTVQFVQRGIPTFTSPAAPATPAPVVWSRTRTTSDGTPVYCSDSFATRPTLGLKRPLCTTESGYTPSDGEFRHHAVRPYYLGGPACIEIGAAEYCGGAGTGRSAAEPFDAISSLNDWDDYEDKDEWEDEDEYGW